MTPKTWTENFDEIHFWKINQQGLTNANTQTQNNWKKVPNFAGSGKTSHKNISLKEWNQRELSDPCDDIVDKFVLRKVFVKMVKLLINKLKEVRRHKFFQKKIKKFMI